jgi:hypothetical protein
VSYAELKALMNTHNRAAQPRDEDSVAIDDSRDDDSLIDRPNRRPRPTKQQPVEEEPKAVARIPPLAEGTRPQAPRSPPRPDDALTLQRQNAVIDAFKHAWRGKTLFILPFRLPLTNMTRLHCDCIV